jgi:hypothetical protein
MDHDRWAKQKARIRDDFDEYILHVYGERQMGRISRILGELLNAWNWSAVRALEMGASVAANTYEGGCAGDDGDSGYDYNGENTAEALREIAAGLAESANVEQAHSAGHFAGELETP